MSPRAAELDGNRQPPMPRELRLRRLAAAPTVGEMRRAARDFALRHEAGAGVAADIALAVSEAVTNAARHAYPGAVEGEVELVVSARPGGRIEILVRDEGGGFKTGPSEGLGAGLMVIGECADTLAIEQGAAGTAVSMVFQSR